MATNFNIIAIDVHSDDQPNQQLLIAFEALLKDDHHKLSEFAHNYYSPLTLDQGNFLPPLSSLHKQHHMLRETLQSVRKNCGTRLDHLDTHKKLSAVLFAGAASVTAAAAAANAKMATVAAAGASAAILLLELRNWIHSLLEKREAAVKKHKEITSLMIIGVERAINDLDAMIASAKSMSENGGGRKKRAAMRKRLRENATDYNNNVKGTKSEVIRFLGLL
ncbi:hypothetical protein SASPL_106372 [Salvia splendens]|uniref:Uncharacterized protein n=1 Tax=Salvia splendens TaxID=180675 RepID=A0A8X8YKS0_SALSN|nr:hypothetical protein SASPL_106372 [Salvia splendens]